MDTRLVSESLKRCRQLLLQVFTDLDVLIVGAGISGLATALGLHRLGISSLVLESSDSLRVSGFAYVTWTNAWRALDALGIGHHLRQLHLELDRLVVASPDSGTIAPERSLKAKSKEQEVRSVQRTLLLQALARELPAGTIRFSSKVVAIEESGLFKLVHVVDGTKLKTKQNIWASTVQHFLDGRLLEVMLISAKTMALDVDSANCSTMVFGLVSGPAMIKRFTEEEFEESPEKLKLFVLNKLAVYHFPDELSYVVKNTELDCFFVVPLRYRRPWELLWKSASQGNMCVAGDALHPMTPDIGQGGCSALEDGVVLARCLAKALKNEKNSDDEIKMFLQKYAKERKWRSIDLITTAYIVGVIQQSNGLVIKFLRKKILSGFLSWLPLKKSDFDCGRLTDP
ncbi:hypothetical protein ACFE04_012679 [Oxalis oulophora]